MDDVSKRFASLTPAELSSGLAQSEGSVDFSACPHSSPRPDEAARIAKARAIIAGCRPIVGTPAEQYLESRGINSGGLPRHIVGFHEASGTIVFVACDQGGAVKACQRVRLDSSGNAILKPDGKKNKLTNGILRSAAMKLPGDGVALACDGPEDALSLWQVTGRPVYCAFGVGQIANLPLLPAEALTIVYDNAPSDAAASRKAAAALVGRGHLIMLTHMPANVKDANDCLVRLGAAAIISAVNEAEPVSVSSFPKSASPPAPIVRLQRGDAIIPVPIGWLWIGWIARGKLILLAGAPGCGKTTVAMAFAAAVSLGGSWDSAWPDGSRCPEPGNVIIWSGEDDPKDTLAPRLLAAGANMSRIHFIQDVLEDGERRFFDPATDIPALRKSIEQIGGVAIIIIDPIVSAVAGDSHKNTEVRRSLQPVVDLAAECDAAVIGITHLSKGTSGRAPTERVTGSLGFAALARVVIMAGKLENEDDEGPAHFIVRAKANIGPDDGAFKYDLFQKELDAHPGIIASYVAWGDKVDATARQLLADAEAPRDGERAIDKANDFLETFLADGPRTKKVVDQAATAHGITPATLRRAQKDLGIKPFHKGNAGEKGGGVWWWALPKGDVPPDYPNKVISFAARRAKTYGAEQLAQTNESESKKSANAGAEEQGAHFPTNDQRNPICQRVSDQGAQPFQNEHLADSPHQAAVETIENIGVSSSCAPFDDFERLDRRVDPSATVLERLDESREFDEDDWTEGTF